MIEYAFVLGSTDPCVPACQYLMTLPSGFLTLASALMWVRFTSRLSARPLRPVVRAGWKAVGAIAIPSSDIRLAQAALAGRQGNDGMVPPPGGAETRPGFAARLWQVCPAGSDG